MVSVRDGLNTRRKFNPKAREDYERKEGNAAQVAQQRAPTVKGEIVASASGMSSQLLHPGPGDGANAPNKLPRQRRPLQEHEDPEQTFMEEFKLFRTSRGDSFAHVSHILNRRLQRTGKPFDMYGLYRAVCIRGGFGSRPDARRHLNMMQVFREMKNHYEKHTYTDIGTQLLNTYETYFLDYERDHPQDLNVTACGRCGATPPRRAKRESVNVIQSVASDKDDTVVKKVEDTVMKDAGDVKDGGDASTKTDATSKVTPTTPSTPASVTYTGTTWAKEGVCEPLGVESIPGDSTKKKCLGWVECDVCRVLTHVDCSTRPNAVDVTPGGEVGWFVCDGCEAMRQGGGGGNGQQINASTRQLGFANTGTPVGASGRGKSPLSSRARASSASGTYARHKQSQSAKHAALKRDRYGGKRENNSTMPHRQTAQFPGQPLGWGAEHIVSNVSSPGMYTYQPGGFGRAQGGGIHSPNGNPHYPVSPNAHPTHPGEFRYTQFNGSSPFDQQARASAESHRQWALQQERESAVAHAARAAMEMEAEAEAARANGLGGNDPMNHTMSVMVPGTLEYERVAASVAQGFPGSQRQQTHSLREVINVQPPPVPQMRSPSRSPRVSHEDKDSPKSSRGRNALGSLPGALLRRSNSAQNILNAANEQPGSPPNERNTAVSPAVLSLTRSASQCSLGAQDFWRGLLDQADGQSGFVADENEGALNAESDLFAFT